METNTIPQTSAATLFNLAFNDDVFMVLGAVYFSLLFYWLFAVWESITDKVWLSVGIIAGLGFSFACILEWNNSSAGVSTFGTAIALGLCIGLALVHPAVSACLLASSLYLRPWELIANDPYLSLLPRLSIVLCLAHLALDFAKKRKLDLAKSPLNYLLMGLLGWCLLSTLFAQDPSGSQSSLFDGFLKSILLYFILFQMVRNPTTLRMLITTLLGSFFFVGAVSVYKTIGLSGLGTEIDFRLKGFGAFANSNDIAALMIFILPFAVMIGIRKGNSIAVKTLALSLSLVSLATVVLSRSRGAVLGIAVMVAVYFIIKIGKRAVVPVAVGMALLAIPAMIIISNRSDRDLEGSSEGRKTYLKAGLRMGMSNPLFGVGFDQFPRNLQTYSTESLEESKQMTAHNSWVLVFAEAGFPGLILFLLCFAYSVLCAWKVYSRTPEYLLALTGYGTAIFFLSHTYLIYPYLLFALVQIAYSFRPTLAVAQQELVA